MKKTLSMVALCGIFIASFPVDASAETVAECGDNLRECIRKSNIEWRRTHDTDELEQSHTMCNIEWAICTVVGLL